MEPTATWPPPPPAAPPASPPWLPQPQPARPTPWGWKAAVAVLATVVVVLAATTAYNNQSARDWKRRSTDRGALIAQLRADLDSSRTRARNLDGQVTDLTSRNRELDGQVAGLQNRVVQLESRLSNVANQKAKAQDLTVVAGRVASLLDDCARSSAQLTTITDPARLRQEAGAVRDLCQQAETANAQLQDAIAAGAG